MKTIRTFSLLFILLFSQPSAAVGIEQSLLELPIEIHNGQPIKLKDMIGKKPTYLKFWASWCVPCREQMPHLEKTYREFGEDINIVSVNIWINESVEAVAATRQEFGLTVPVALDKSGELAQAFNFIATPYHILLDDEGEIVHQGHQADADLDQKIALLAMGGQSDLPVIALESSGADAIDFADPDEDFAVLFFTATWCDWYLEESRPSMSQACVQAQRIMNEVHEQLPDVKLMGIASRLWTAEAELEEYVAKHDVKHAFVIDKTNDVFFSLKVKTLPTMVIMKHGKEVQRTSNLDSAQNIANLIEAASM